MRFAFLKNNNSSFEFDPRFLTDWIMMQFSLMQSLLVNTGNSKPVAAADWNVQISGWMKFDVLKYHILSKNFRIGHNFESHSSPDIKEGKLIGRRLAAESIAYSYCG